MNIVTRAKASLPWTPERSPIDSHTTIAVRPRTPEGSPVDNDTTIAVCPRQLRLTEILDIVPCVSLLCDPRRR
jgi:hypothetical protein